MNKRNQITEGVIWKQLLLFFFPIVFGTFFQQIYNTADTIVVGRFVGKEALAAVGGSVNQIVNLIVEVFVGLTSGAAVVVSQFFGAQDRKNLDKTVHTSFAFSLVAGAIIGVAGFLLSDAVLEAMNTPAELMADSRRPLYVLMTACILNIVLDIVLVVAAGMGVRGVAIATVSCQGVSAVLVTGMLMRDHGFFRLEIKKIRFYGASLKSILRIGIPAGIEAAMYCVANIVIQVFVNRLGTDYVAAWGTFGKIDAVFWMVVNAFSIAITTFVGQNYGAGKTRRMRKSVRVCLGMSYSSAILLSGLLIVFAEPLYRLFTTDNQVVEIGVYMMRYLMPSYFLYVAIGILSGALRGAGKVLVPVILTCGGVCIMRITWMLAVLPVFPGIETIMLSYPVSWGITAVLFVIYYLKKFPKAEKMTRNKIIKIQKFVPCSKINKKVQREE